MLSGAQQAYLSCVMSYRTRASGSPSRPAVSLGSAARFALGPQSFLTALLLTSARSIPGQSSGCVGEGRVVLLWLLPSRPKGATLVALGAAAMVPSGAPGRPRGPWSWSPQTPEGIHSPDHCTGF